MIRALVSLIFTVLLVVSVSTTAAIEPYQTDTLGQPSVPTRWQPQHWALTVSGRLLPLTNGQPMQASHGANCASPPSTHSISDTTNDTVFVCNDHVMTALNSGYMAVYMTPDRKST